MIPNTCVHTTQPTITLTDCRCALAGLCCRIWLNNHSPMIAVSLTYRVRKICLGTHYANHKWEVSTAPSIQRGIRKQYGLMYVNVRSVVDRMHCCEFQLLSWEGNMWQRKHSFSMLHLRGTVFLWKTLFVKEKYHVELAEDRQKWPMWVQSSAVSSWRQQINKSASRHTHFLCSQTQHKWCMPCYCGHEWHVHKTSNLLECKCVSDCMRECVRESREVKEVAHKWEVEKGNIQELHLCRLLFYFIFLTRWWRFSQCTHTPTPTESAEGMLADAGAFYLMCVSLRVCLAPSRVRDSGRGQLINNPSVGALNSQRHRWSFFRLNKHKKCSWICASVLAHLDMLLCWFRKQRSNLKET